MGKNGKTAHAVYVYGLKDPHTGRIYYVGKSTNPARRLIDHRNSGGTAVAKWIRTLGGLPDITILAVVFCENPRQRTNSERLNILRLERRGEPLLNVAHIKRNQKSARLAKDLRQ